MERFLADLNEAQRRAVTHGEGPLLVVAGAGSGKTRVITRRIAWLLAVGVPARRILGVTFTNKAAREMAERVQALVPGARVRVSTFHSACAAFLRSAAPKIGRTPEYTIYDTADRDRLLKALLKEHGFAGARARPAAVGARISRLKNAGVRPADFSPNPFAPLDEIVKVVYGPYDEALRSMNALDFDDLLLSFLELLRADEEERARFSRRFQHLLVDEFQDTNRIQYEIVRILAAPEDNLCVVGDPDQSIYRFRGAEVANILSFPQDYPETTIVKLERNYRSTPQILAFAQGVIACNRLRHEKRLEPTLPDGPPVEYLEADDEEDEARIVRARISALLDDGAAAGEIAVFYRARFLSRGFETALRRAGLPFRLVGDLGFFERKEVKDLLAFLKVAVNPADRLSFERILNVPPRGIGRVTADRLFAAAAEAGRPAAAYLAGGGEVPGAAKRARAGLAELGRILAEGAEVAHASAAAALEVFLERTDYLEAVCRTGAPEDEEREENVAELLRDARRFDEECAAGETGGEPGASPAAAYLAQVSLLVDAEEDRGEPGGAVQMMTVHQAKGLEFDHVFVVGLEEGLFPHARALDEDGGLEEERRLFYVAATRARRSLVLTRALMRRGYGGGARWSEPSRFLAEGGIEIEDRRRPTWTDAARLPGGGWGDAPEPVFYDPEAPPVFRPGERVRHPTFGFGEVLETRGRGAGARVRVHFDGAGVRTLLIAYAGLERAEGG